MGLAVQGPATGIEFGRRTSEDDIHVPQKDDWENSGEDDLKDKKPPDQENVTRHTPSRSF